MNTRNAELYDKLANSLVETKKLKLVENHHKPHWNTFSIRDLCEGVIEETVEFMEELFDVDSDSEFVVLRKDIDIEKLRKEAADVANYLDFIIDNVERGHVQS